MWTTTLTCSGWTSARPLQVPACLHLAPLTPAHHEASQTPQTLATTLSPHARASDGGGMTLARIHVSLLPPGCHHTGPLCESHNI